MHSGEEEEDLEDKPNPVPVFICHEIDPAAAKLTQLKGKSTKGVVVNDDAEDASEDNDLFKAPKKAKHFQHAFPDELDYRPAAMAPFPTIIKQITAQTHALLNQYGCQRLAFDKHKPKVEGSKPEDVREGMDRKLNRLKIYRRAFSSLVIYFRAYSPILFYIKKSYEDMITYRTRQFREAQHEKVKLYYEKVSINDKMHQYRFPDYNRLQASQKYLNLLLSRIQKQDEAIKFITDILSKMERALSDHYEQGRDMEDQIKLIENDLSDRREKAMYPKKKYMDIPEDKDNKDVTAEIDNTAEDGTDPDEDPVDENEEIDEDKRMVLILAYAVCLKDLEEAERKLKIYETKYQNIAPRHELETVKRKIVEEKDQVKFLQEERDTLEMELEDLKEQDILVNQELNNLLQMSEDDKLDAIKQKFVRQKGINKDVVDEDDDIEEMISDSEEEIEDPVEIDDA